VFRSGFSREPMTLATYGHVIEELDTAKRRSAEELIRTARAKSVRATFAQRQRHGGWGRKIPGKPRKPSDGLEPSTPSLPWRIRPAVM
jgi:hypothetical protein